MTTTETEPTAAQPQGPTPEQQRALRFTEIEHERRTLEDRLKVLKKEKAKLEPQILADFEAGKVQNSRVNGLLIYLHRQLWASAKDGDRARACAALKAAGLGDYVEEGFNSSSLSAWVREQDATGQELPKELQETLNVSEVFSVRTRQ